MKLDLDLVEEIQQEFVKEMAQVQLEFGVEMLLDVKVCTLTDCYQVAYISALSKKEY